MKKETEKTQWYHDSETRESTRKEEVKLFEILHVIPECIVITIQELLTLKFTLLLITSVKMVSD